MKKFLIAAGCVLMLMQSAFAQKVLLKSGDQYIGGKLALGSVGGASVGFVGTYEMGLQDNIGIGGSVAYSGYSDSYGYGAWSGEWKYTNIFIVATGTYHMDLLKNDKIDTWGALHLGYNVASASFSWTSSGVPSWVASPSVSAGGFIVGISANARYFVSDNLAVAGSIGFGMGILNLGVDYKF